MGIDTNSICFEIRECVVMHHFFSSAHTRGVFKEDCTYDFGSLPDLIHNVECLLITIPVFHKGMNTKGHTCPMLKYTGSKVICPCSTKGMHNQVLMGQNRNPLMEETMSTTQVVKVFFMVHGSVCIINSMHGVLDSGSALVCCLPTVLTQNL